MKQPQYDVAWKFVAAYSNFINSVTLSTSLNLRHCLFSLVRNPVQQLSISKEPTEKSVGIEVFVPGFEGERERSTRPAMRVLTAGPARACIHNLMLQRPLYRQPVLLDTPFILHILNVVLGGAWGHIVISSMTN